VVLAALDQTDEALGWVRTHAVLAMANRERFSAELRAIGFAPLPSAANFVFVPSARAVLLARGMRERGVLVRAFGGLPRDLGALAESNGEALRIGVGPWETLQQVLDTLREVA
jgi:histidinol-phosphate aminotransferase